MPSFRNGAVWRCLFVAVAAVALSNVATAVEVWSGLTKSFTRPDDVDGYLPENQDMITANVVIARDAMQGIFNAAYESNFIGTSPEFTEWATDLVAGNETETIEATNWANLTFSTWVDAYDALLHNQQLPGNLTSRRAVVYLTLDDVYLDLQFTGWGIGGAGGFSYLRAEPTVTEPTGDYNGDGTVNLADYTTWRDTLTETVDNPGDGADGDLSGVIDEPDYDFWKVMYANQISGGGGGQASAVPEPTGLLLLVGGLLALLLVRCVSRRGPGQETSQ